MNAQIWGWPRTAENDIAASLSLDAAEALAEMLAHSRIEVFPAKSILEKARMLPPGSSVPVSCSPKRGVEATIEICEEFLSYGLHPVPHIAARMVRDRAHLRSLLDAVSALLIDDIFVVGGDGKEPAGHYPSAFSLLNVIYDMGYEFAQVGITAYPEGHPLIPDDVLNQALRDKQPFATYMITQMCFDPQTIIDWLVGVREGGINLPLYIGLPGASQAQKLLRFALQIGVGESTRFLSKHTNLVKELVGPDYRPTHLVTGLAPYLANPDYQIEGFHIFTFNQLEDTERWRNEMLSGLPQIAGS